MGLIGGILKKAGKEVLEGALNGVVENHKDDLTNTLQDVVSDTIHSMIARKESIQNWAELASEGIDSIIKRAVDEENLQYVGGKLSFAFSKKNTQKIDISFELYFLNEEKQWQKLSAKSDVYASTFTDESLEDLRNNGVIEYTVKE